MAIQITCPNCFKRFNVSEKFAGKTGPCPSCQKPIKIPDKAEEVVIHAPADAGPKDSTGKSVLKPLRRKEVQIGLPVILGASIGTVAVFAIALGLRLSGGQPPTALLASAAILLSPPLVFVGYWFLHDDELEGFNGKQLLVRCGICSIVFAALWAVYAFVPAYISGYSSMSEISGIDMVVFIPLMIAIGSAVSVAALELEIAQGAMHYCLYLGVTFILAWLSGTPLANPLSGGAVGADSPPAIVSPNEKVAPPASSDKKIPNLLQ